MPRIGGIQTSRFLPVAAITAIVLLGYWGAFAGGNFFIHENILMTSNYSHGNVDGIGWRPDKGLGISFFFGDPGLWHAWSLLTWWEKIAPSREFAYTASVIGLGLIAAIVQYLFIRRVNPRLGPLAATLLAPLIVFCSDQAGYHYLRLSISLLIGIPLMLMLLYDHYHQPRVTHVFLAALLFWFVAFFGNMWSLTQILTLGGAFTVLYLVYFKVPWRTLLARFATLYVFGGLLFLFLGAWIIYPMVLEQQIVGYVREKTITLDNISLLPDLRGLFRYLVGLLFVDLMPANHELAGAQKPFLYTFNVSVVFPLVFLFFIFRRAEGFWEFALKTLLAVFVIHWGLMLSNLIPGYGAVFSYLSAKTSKLFTMYDFIFPLQVCLIGVYVGLIGKEKLIIVNRWGRWLQRGVALLLCGVFASLVAVSVVALVRPDALPATTGSLIGRFAPDHLLGYPRDYVAALAIYDVQRFQELIGWHTLAFYATSLLLVAPFVRDAWLVAISRLPKSLVAGALIVNGLLLSWAIYPLNDKALVWEQKELQAYRFESTDRFYFVRDNRPAQGASAEQFRTDWAQVEGGGHRERQIGLLEPPGLNLSGVKSFATQDEGDFMYRVFNGDGVQRVRHLRTYYGGPLVVSPLLDMAAVKYYYSDREIQDLPEQLSLHAKAKQLYVYRNHGAWPYFYLAERMIALQDNKIPTKVQRGTAYVNVGSYRNLPADTGDSSIRLKAFSGGRMVFDFFSRHDEFLVVADAWHPFWRARANGHELPVTRANFMFKGIQLPPGKYELTLYFDTSAYLPGIYLSVLGWTVLVAGLFVTLKRESAGARPMRRAA